MALSMLTACGGSDDNTVATVTAATTNTGVVAYVENNIGTKSYGVSDNQKAQVPFTGNESADKTKIMDDIAENYGMSNVYDVTTLQTVALPTGSGDSAIYYVLKGDNTDEELGQAILTMLGAKVTNDYCVNTISVFDVSIDISGITYTVDGSAVGISKEYWAIRVVNCKKATDIIVD